MRPTAPDFDGNSGAPIPAAPKLPSEGWSDPARFCWNLNTCRAGSRFANPSFARKQLRRTGAMQNRGRSSLGYAPASRRSGAVGGCARYRRNTSLSLLLICCCRSQLTAPWAA